MKVVDKLCEAIQKLSRERDIYRNIAIDAIGEEQVKITFEFVLGLETLPEGEDK